MSEKEQRERALEPIQQQLFSIQVGTYVHGGFGVNKLPRYPGTYLALEPYYVPTLGREVGIFLIFYTLFSMSATYLGM